MTNSPSNCELIYYWIRNCFISQALSIDDQATKTRVAQSEMT